MLDSLKKLVSRERPKGSKKSASAPEYIFMLDPERKKEYLLDLRTILRTPGARRALPTLHMLETTVTRNERRIRIPHPVMPSLVCELLSVERRIPAQSPLREVMSAVPGLERSMSVEPTPTSILMGGHETLPGDLSTREMNTAARRIGEALAGGTPRPLHKSGQTTVLPGMMVMDTLNPSMPMFGNTAMNSLDQQRFLDDSRDQMESAVLRTSELADSDLAAYFDLCLMSGENEKVIDALLPRVAEQPTFWAWIRLLNAAKAAGKIEYEVWCSTFRTWVGREHPALMPDMLADSPDDLEFGVRRVALHEREQRELAR